MSNADRILSRANELSIDAFLQIITLQRLNELHEKNVVDSRFVKYTRKHLLNVYDALYMKKSFESQIIKWYLERTVSVFMQYRRVVKVNVNEDSDLFIDENDVFDEDDDQRSQSRSNIAMNDEDNVSLMNYESTLETWLRKTSMTKWCECFIELELLSYLRYAIALCFILR